MKVSFRKLKDQVRFDDPDSHERCVFQQPSQHATRELDPNVVCWNAYVRIFYQNIQDKETDLLEIF